MDLLPVTKFNHEAASEPATLMIFNQEITYLAVDPATVAPGCIASAVAEHIVTQRSRYRWSGRSWQ